MKGKAGKGRVVRSCLSFFRNYECKDAREKMRNQCFSPSFSVKCSRVDIEMPLVKVNMSISARENIHETGWNQLLKAAALNRLTGTDTGE